MTVRLVWPLLVTLMTGCISIPDFDEPSVVDRPRVLAIVAEPPGAAPGEPVELTVLMAAPRGDSVQDYTVTWSACGAFFTNIMGSQYGDEPQEQGCSGFAVPLGDGPQVSMPGAVTRQLFDNLELAEDIFGAFLPEGTVEAIKGQVGLPVLIEARVEAGDRVVRAVKRVLVGDTVAHSNPPPPHFDFDRFEIVANSEQPFRCRAADVDELLWPIDTRVELAPRVDPSEADGEDTDLEPWVEEYNVLNARGEVTPRRETPFYSWFSHGGSLDQGVTEAPLRNEVWRTPGLPGPTPLWLVVRDGQGGTSACELEVQLFDPGAPDTIDSTD